MQYENYIPRISAQNLLLSINELIDRQTDRHIFVHICVPAPVCMIKVYTPTHKSRCPRCQDSSLQTAVVIYRYFLLRVSTRRASQTSWSSLMWGRVSSSIPTGRSASASSTLPPKMHRLPGDGGCSWPGAKRWGCNISVAVPASICSWLINSFLSQHSCPPEQPLTPR